MPAHSAPPPPTGVFHIILYTPNCPEDCNTSHLQPFFSKVMMRSLIRWQDDSSMTKPSVYPCHSKFVRYSWKNGLVPPCPTQTALTWAALLLRCWIDLWHKGGGGWGGAGG